MHAHSLFKTQIETTDNYPTFDALQDFCTGAISPEAVKLRLFTLFIYYSQFGVDRALARKENLIEWFQKTRKRFEGCQNLKSFLDCCFHGDKDSSRALRAQFPDLFRLLKKLESEDPRLLKDVNTFRLLEALKQISGRLIYEEIARIFLVQQAQVARETRRLQEEKENTLRKYEQLKQEMGVTSPNSSYEEEMASIAWRYFIHNLPLLFNDIKFVNGACAVWKTWKLFTQIEWTQMLIGWLDMPEFPYSQLPKAIKDNLKIYLNSYVKDHDYADLTKLQKSLIGPPKVVQLQNSGKNILRISGGYLALSIILKKIKVTNLKGMAEIQILASETLFMDTAMPRFSGINIVMAANIIDISLSVTICTSGMDAKQHDAKKAKDGRAFGYSSTASGFNGESGKPGDAGQSAGHIHIQAGEKIINPHLLRIIANGGNGANGQDGGLGDDGQDGQDGLDAENYGDGSKVHFCRKVQINRGTKGSLGQPGGNGGDGGLGGEGGFAGDVVVCVNEKDYHEVIRISAVSGANGISGKPSEGGKAGLDGRRGVDKGAAFTGVSFRKNQYLAGLDVEAKFIKRPWYEKDYYQLTARVPEGEARLMERQCTNTHGQTGKSQHAKNTATKNAAIDFNSILHQCPQMTVSLSIQNATQVEQGLNELGEMRNHCNVLDSEIESIEKQQKLLAEQQHALQEMEEFFATQRLNQSVAAERQVEQLADRKSYRTKEENFFAEDLLGEDRESLLKQTQEKLHDFMLSKPVDDRVNFSEYLDEKIILLANQPVILHIFYQKLSAEVALNDPVLSISAEELSNIIGGFTGTESDDSSFFSSLYETPLASWKRLLRRRSFQQKLLLPSEPQQKRCLISLGRLEESLGQEKIDRFVECIQKAGDRVNYAILANLLMQLCYQQLTLDDECLALIEAAAFENWPAIFREHHGKEIKKPRDLPVLLSIMQNNVANQGIRILFSQDDNPPVILRQIEAINTYLVEDTHPLTDFLFQEEEIIDRSAHFSSHPINTWKVEDMLVWSKAFQQQANCRELVAKHLAEMIAIIARAIYLVHGFYPRDVQYIALLIAYEGSDHAQKIVSQIDTGEGKTLIALMHALLRVFAGDKVDYITSSSVLAEEAEAEMNPVCSLFGITTSCNTESNDGPFFLELLEGEPTESQKEVLCNKKGTAIVKKGKEYFLAFANYKGEYAELSFDLANWPNLASKLTQQAFQARRCKVSDGLHEDVFQLIQNYALEELILKFPNETQKLQQSYRCHILCGDLQSFMRAYLLRQFYGIKIENRCAFVFMDEVDRLLDEMRDTLYLSHDVRDTHYLNNLFIAIWASIHEAFFADPTEKNIAILTDYFLKQLSPGTCSYAQQLQGRIHIPSHLESLVRRRLSDWVRSAYAAKYELRQDEEYIVEQVKEESGRGVYLVDQDTGVTSLNKKYGNALQEFLLLKNGRYPNYLNFMAILLNPMSYLQEICAYGFSGMTGTLGSEPDRRYFDKLFGFKVCIIPRYKHLDLQVEKPILVSSVREQREVTANLVHDIAVVSGQPVEIICDTIADVKKLSPFIREKAPTAPLYERIHSFKSFSKGTRQDRIKSGEVISGTLVCARGVDPELDEKVQGQGLCLVEQSVYKHLRAKRQADGRTARKGLPGKLIMVLCPQHGETSMEEMQDREYLRYEQSLERFRLKELQQHYTIRKLFLAFAGLAREIENIVGKEELGCALEGYVIRQMAALRSHWALWLDEVQQQMEKDNGWNEEIFNAQFQVFRKAMLALAEEKGIIKLTRSPGEITQLGIWLGEDNSFYSQAIECFDHVIQYLYQFAALAMYKKAQILVNMAKSGDFPARKESIPYLKASRGLLQQEIQVLYESADRMAVITDIFRKEGHGLHHNHFKETVYGMIQALKIIQGSIDAHVGFVTDAAFFLPDTDDKQKAEKLFRHSIKVNDIKGYRISKKISIAEETLSISLVNGYRQEVEFPSEFNTYKSKMISFIAAHRGDRASRTVSYKQYCLEVFGTKEDAVEETQKMLMQFSWQFLLQENVISPPRMNKQRVRWMSIPRASDIYDLPKRALPLALGDFSYHDEIRVFTQELQNQCERGTIPMEVFTFFKEYLQFNRLFMVEKKPVHFSWSAAGMLALAGLQIAVGMGMLMFACPALVQQGLGDLFFLTMSVIQGDVSWENYGRYKRIALRNGAVTLGVTSSINWLVESQSQIATYINSAVKNFPKPVRETITSLVEGGSQILSTAQILMVPAPALREFKPQSILTQIYSGFKDLSKQVATEMTLQGILVITRNVIESRARESIAKDIQVNTEKYASIARQVCMDILKYSESPEQGLLIIARIMEATLNEFVHERFTPIIDTRFLSTSELGRIVKDGMAGDGLIGDIAGFVVRNLNEIGAIPHVFLSANNLLFELNYNLMHKLNELQEMGEQQTFDALQIEAYGKKIDELIEKMVKGVGDTSMYVMGNIILRPMVDLTYQKIIDLVEKRWFAPSASVDPIGVEEENVLGNDEEENNNTSSYDSSMPSNDVPVSVEENNVEHFTEVKEPEPEPSFNIFDMHVGQSWLGGEYYKRVMKGNMAKRIPEFAFNKEGDVHCCTIAFSYAARMTGWRFPEVPGKTVSWEYQGETCYAFYRVMDVLSYLKEFLGPPIQLKNGDDPEDGVMVKVWGHNRGGTFTSRGHATTHRHGVPVFIDQSGPRSDAAFYWPWSLVAKKIKEMNRKDEVQYRMKNK